MATTSSTWASRSLPRIRRLAIYLSTLVHELDPA